MGEGDLARYIGHVGCPDVLGAGEVTAIVDKAVYELDGVFPTVLLDPLVTRGEEAP